MTLTRKRVLEFLKDNKLMSLATFGKFPWIATVYYTFDQDLNLYFLSSPSTLHCQQIAKNNQVAVAIADSRQDINSPKRGLQLWGTAQKISDAAKIKHTLALWKSSLKVANPKLSYENIINKIISGRMYQISPKRIKLFDHKLFPSKNGQEPVLEI